MAIKVSARKTWAAPEVVTASKLNDTGTPIVSDYNCVNISAAKAQSYASCSTGDQFSIAGYDAPGDGGGGQFNVDKDDTTTDENGVTVFVASDGTRLKTTNPPGTIYAKQGGCKGDGVADDTIRAQACIDALPATGGTVIFSYGTFLISTLDFPNEPKVVNIVGAGKHSTCFQMATAAGPMFRKVQTAGRITGAIFSDFSVKAHAGSTRANLNHKIFAVSGWSNSHWKRIKYKFQNWNGGSTVDGGSVGVVFDIAGYPYLAHQNTFEGIDSSANYGPSRVFYFSDGGSPGFAANIAEIRDGWFYGSIGIAAIIDASGVTRLSVKNNIFEDCAGATGVIMGQNTLVEGNWFELLGQNITTNALGLTDGSGSTVISNYFSGTGTSFIDSIGIKPLWIGNAGSGQTVTGSGVLVIAQPGANPALPVITGGDGTLVLGTAAFISNLDMSGRVTVSLKYDNTPATTGAKKFTVGAITGYTMESYSVGYILVSTGEPRPWGLDQTSSDFWVSVGAASPHWVIVRAVYRKN